MIGKTLQTMADAALEVCGTGESMFNISHNENVSLSSTITGRAINTSKVADKKNIAYYVQNRVSPATEYTSATEYIMSDDDEIITNNNNINIEV